MTDDVTGNRHEQGMKVRREVLGDEHVDRAVAGTTEPVADRIVDRWLTPAFAAAHPEVRAHARAMLLASPPVPYAACCGAIERMDLLDVLPKITAPTLVIAGADDPATPPEGHADLIAAGIPGARLEVVADAAHLGNYEQPEAFGRLILGHLEAM